MLPNKKGILKNPRLCQSIFGVNKEEIERLLPVFSQCLIAYRYQLKPREQRRRKIGGGRKGDLPTAEDKLFYILMFLKIYPTYDVLSVLANHQRSKCGDSVQLLLPALEMALGRALVLPKRKARTLEEVFERCPELRDVFMDGTERRTQKPRNLKRRNKLYSGKKKAATRKNIILSTEKKGILFMSKTKSGRRHDKRLADKLQLPLMIPPHVALWTDTGFQGIKKLHPNSVLPDKATGKHPLSESQKQNNRIISGLRVVSEHALVGYKRFKAASDTYRNRLQNMDDMMNSICAGLWNFHLGQTI
jgi:hypothetical protein